MSKHTHKEPEPRADDTTARSTARQQEEARLAEEQVAQEQETAKTAPAPDPAITPSTEQKEEPQTRTSEPFAGVTLETKSETGSFKILNGEEPLKDSEGNDLTFKDRQEADRIAAQLRISRPTDQIKVDPPAEEQK